MPGLKKKPSHVGAAGLDQAADGRGHRRPKRCATRIPKKLIPPLHGALLKNEQDVHLFERLAFLSRRERGGD